MSNVVAVSCNPYEESKEHGRPQAAKKSPVGSFLVFGSHPVGMSHVVAAAAFARGIFNLTRTGIAAELTAGPQGRFSITSTGRWRMQRAVFASSVPIA